MVHKRNKKCFIRNCKSGYITNPEKCILFPIPKDLDELEEWEISIGRKLSPDDVVCEKHFAPHDILRDPLVEGETKLREGAVPTELTYLTKKRRRGRPAKHNVPLKKRRFLQEDDDADYVTQSTIKLENQIDAAKITTPARAPPVVKLIQPGSKPKVLILMHKKPNILNKNVKMINLDPKTLKIIENIKLNAKVPQNLKPASNEAEPQEENVAESSESEQAESAFSDSTSEVDFFSENSEGSNKSEERLTKRRELKLQRKLNLQRRKNLESIRTLQRMRVLPRRKYNILKKKNVSVQEKVDEIKEVTTSKPAKVPVPCFIMLYEKNLRLNLPPFWGQSSFSNGEKRFVIFTETYFEKDKPVVKRQAVLDEDNQLSYFFNGKEVKRVNLISKLPVNILTLQSLEYALTSFTSLPHCPGGPGENEFQIKGSRISSVDSETSKWRHYQCCMITRKDQECCKFCRYLYKVFKFAPKGRRVTPEDRNFILSLKNKDLQRKLNRLSNRLEALENSKHNQDDDGNTQQILYSQIKGLPLLQKKMIMECINSGKHKKRGRRYSLDWIRVCVNIFGRNATMYEYLKENNILPLCDLTTIRKYIKGMSSVDENNIASEEEEEVEEHVSDIEDTQPQKVVDDEEDVPYFSENAIDTSPKRTPQIFEDFE